MKMKRELRTICLAMIFCGFCATASGQPTPTPTPALLAPPPQVTLETVDKTPLQQAYQRLPQEVRALWNDKGVEQMLLELMQSGQVETEDFAGKLLRIVLWQSKQTLKVVLLVLCLGIIGGIAGQVKLGFGSGGSELATFACYTMAMIAVCFAFSQTVQTARNAIQLCADITQTAFPILLILLSATGAVASAGLFQSATVMLTTSMGYVVSTVLMPLILALGAVAIISNISQSVPLKNLQAMLKSALKWIIGILSTFYLGALSLRCIAAKGMDGLSVRAARFALDKLVPYVGGILSGSMESILGVNILVKNAFGICFCLLICALLLLPLLEIGLMQFAFRACAALLEPIMAKSLAKGLADLADVLGYVFAIAAIALLMLLLTVGLILSCV